MSLNPSSSAQTPHCITITIVAQYCTHVRVRYKIEQDFDLGELVLSGLAFKTVEVGGWGVGPAGLATGSWRFSSGVLDPGKGKKE
jgi:hypothetical protein